MLKKTHIASGIASALILTTPSTIPNIISGIIGGAIGGWIADIDCKIIDYDKETIYDSIINGLFILLFVLLDFIIGKGICNYILSNWGISIWISLILFLLLLVFGFKSKHRTFTHSFASLIFFTICIYFLCRPMTLTFAIGYFSHIFIDLFNKKGLQLFYPLKWKFSLNICHSDKKANNILYMIMVVLSTIIASILFSQTMINNTHIDFVNKIQTLTVFDFNVFQLYLVLINVFTFFLAERSYANSWRENFENIDTIRIQTNFETWILNIFIFLGGSIGMIISLVIHFAFPSAYNGNWWSFCYTSFLFWGTVYLYIMNPFNLTLGPINFFTINKLFLLIYLFAINILSSYILYRIKERRFKDNSLAHTFLLLLGSIGGTLGAIISVTIFRKFKKFHYVSLGFILMLIGQIIFLSYLMLTNVI